MSGDPKLEYISDGIAEEIISSLSVIQSILVIARTSSFKYKGKEIDVRTVGRELGVRYVLEGSFRKVDDKVRIIAKLIDAKTRGHLWVERYDRDFKDFLKVQDEIILKIITGLQVKLVSSESTRLVAKGTQNLTAYLKRLEGWSLYWREGKESRITGVRLIKEAIALDPEFPAAYSTLAFIHMMDAFYQTTKSPEQSFKQAIELAQKAIALDESLASAHALLGFLYALIGQYDKGISEGKRAVALCPNGHSEHSLLSITLRYAGRCEEAIPMVEKAIQLNPLGHFSLYRSLAWARICTGSYKAAIAACKEAINRQSNDIFTHLALAIAYNLSGREEEAHAEVKEVLKIDPEFTVGKYEKDALRYKNKAFAETLANALRTAGLPE
jgi:adenylate cyclase